VKKPPPRKLAGQAKGRRRIDGVVKDVHGMAVWLGRTEKAIRAEVARGALPHRRLGGRVLFVVAEVEAFLAQLPGVTVGEALANVAKRQPAEVSAARPRTVPA
jgi:hypothetical protein